MNVSIDSFKIRIPMDHITLKKEELIHYFAPVNVTTGEVDEAEFKRRRLAIQASNITTSYSIARIVDETKTAKEYVVILINAKLLQKRYFEGITPENLQSIYVAIMLQGVVSFSLPTFINSPITDIDLKFDYQVESFKVQREIIYSAKQLTALSECSKIGHNVFTRSDNLGIEWNRREHATPVNPYVKIYAKDVEILNQPKTRRFAMEYFNIKHIKPMLRLEGTLKNKVHFHRILKDIELSYMIPDKPKLNLSNLLNEELMAKALSHIFRSVTESALSLKSESIKEVQGLYLSDLFALCLLELCGSVEVALFRLKSFEIAPAKATRAKKKLQELSHYLNKDKNHSIDQADKFFNMVFCPTIKTGKLLGVPSSSERSKMVIDQGRKFESESNSNASHSDKVIKCTCEMPAKMHNKNFCWRCNRTLS